MYTIVKNVINGKAYTLTDILTKINTLWVQGDLTDDQKTELVLLAQENENPDTAAASLQSQIDALRARVEALESNDTTEAEGGIAEYAEPEPRLTRIITAITSCSVVPSTFALASAKT